MPYQASGTPRFAFYDTENEMRQQLITAGFFIEGLQDASTGENVRPNYDVLIETWGKGCIELVDSLVSYVPLATSLCEAAARACHDNYPGVFDYEVSSRFGKWFGEHILQHGHEPSQLKASAWLISHIGEFFAQGVTEQQAESVKIEIQQAFILTIKSAAFPAA